MLKNNDSFYTISKSYEANLIKW